MIGVTSTVPFQDKKNLIIDNGKNGQAGSDKTGQGHPAEINKMANPNQNKTITVSQKQKTQE